MSSSVERWYLRISRRATVPGLRTGSAEGLVGHRAGATGRGQARLNRCGLRAAAASPPPCALAAEAHTARGARQRHARHVQRHIARAGRTWIRCSSACALGRTAHLVRAARHPPGRRYAQREVVALRLPAARVLWDTLRRAGRFFQPGGAKQRQIPRQTQLTSFRLALGTLLGYTKSAPPTWRRCATAVARRQQHGVSTSNRACDTATATWRLVAPSACRPRGRLQQRVTRAQNRR